MNKIFIFLYVFLVVALLIVTPYDLQITHNLYGDAGLLMRLISDCVYVPIFFIGYLGIFYYYQRIYVGLSHKLLKLGFLLGTVFGIILLTYIFIRSMRFLPYYLVLSPLFIVVLMMIAWLGSEYIIKNELKQFDYLLVTELEMIIILFFLVTFLKRLFGRARYYMVLKNEALYTPWYKLHGMVYERDFYSTPSGHTTFVAITFWFILVVFTVPQFRKYITITVTSVLLWVGIQGYIRVLLGEHFITDVILSVILTLALLHVLYYVSMYGRFYLKRKFNI